MKPKLKKYVAKTSELQGVEIEECYLWKDEAFDTLKPFKLHQTALRNELNSIQSSLKDAESELDGHDFNESKEIFPPLSGFISGNTSLYTKSTYIRVKELGTKLSSYSSRIKSYCSQQGMSIPNSLSQLDRHVDKLFQLNLQTEELARKCFIPDLSNYLEKGRRKSTMTDIYIGHGKRNIKDIVIGKFDIDSRTYIDHFLIRG